MARLTTKSLENIERKMGEMDENSVRYRVLQSAKKFKTSWIELGQALFSVWKDKLYKEWGYMTFEAYTAKEIGIKKPTALKLLKSYYFLEKEEPAYLHKGLAESRDIAASPSLDSVNILRLARNKKTLDADDYRTLRRDVLDSGKDASDVKKSLTGMIRQAQELEPQAAREKNRITKIKRFLALLKALKTDIETSRMLPLNILKETSHLITRIESEII